MNKDKYDLNRDSGKKPWWYVVGYTILEWLEGVWGKIVYFVKWYFMGEEMKRVWLHRVILLVVVIVLILSVHFA